MSDPSDGGRALVPAVLVQDVGAPPHPSRAAGADVIGGTATAIAKAESLQERESRAAGADVIGGTATAIAKVESLQERESRADIIGGTATAIAKAESLQECESHEEAQGEVHSGLRVHDGLPEDAQGDGEVRAPRSAARSHQFIGESGVHGTLPMGNGQE